MKRFQKVFIIIVLIFSLFEHNMRSFADNKTFNSIYGDNLLEYIQGYNDNLLLNRKNYGYMNLVENFKSDWISLYFLEMTDFFIKTGAEPDKRKYMDVLLNIIATYDFDNASAISEQNNLDNMKQFKDYALDFAKMGKDTVSIIIGNSSTSSHLESSIATAIDGLSVLAENTDNWINAISDLETIVQNYEKYDSFLKLIEKKGEGELREAATTLRKGMSEAIEIKLNTYIEVSNKNFENYSEFFFSDVFFTILKQSPQYSSNENIKFFVDCGDNIIAKIGTLDSSWELSKLIGKLVGNIAVGGENKINRLLEMMALHDVSVILQEKIIEISNEFVEKYGIEDEEMAINEYVLYSQYLTGCRIRGEYCLYSTVADDSGLLAWFNKKSAEDAKIWYVNKADQIAGIQEKLLKIFSVSENVYQEKKIDYIVDYNQIINQYSEGRYKYYADLEKENLNPLISSEYIEQLYYALYDLNDDNIPELIIACDDTKNIIDIRTYYNSNVIRLFDDHYRLGLRNSCTIGEDNCVYIFEPCGAYKFYEYIYEINVNQDNCLAEIKSYELIVDNESNIKYYDITGNDNVEISREQYESRVINNYNNGSKFEWQLIE